MTPLIRSVMQSALKAGIDPTEMHWFDISGVPLDSVVRSDWLIDYRPPFNRCMVVWQGATKNHAKYELWMQVATDDPNKGVAVAVYKGAHGQPPTPIPPLVYFVDGGVVRYGPLYNEHPVDKEAAEMMLAVVSEWYAHLARESRAYVPSVENTFTNRRKAAQGKPVSYTWRTVTVAPVRARSESKGGTHAPPRQHDRRGHLRRLRNGKSVWVRPCKVGSAAHGTVFHDYKVLA